jgi:uncharacterized coiled-coil protein SlyX
MHQHVKELSKLVRQLKHVVDRINQADPGLLAPTAQESPWRTR